MKTNLILTRRELERAAIWMQLNENYDSVSFFQSHASGIGTQTWARFFKIASPDQYEEVDITEIESW